MGRFFQTWLEELWHNHWNFPRYLALSQFCRHGFLASHFRQVYYQTSLVAQAVKHLPTMRETRVLSLGWEDLLEKEMAIHSSILAWKSHRQRSLVGCSPWGRKESNTTEILHFYFHYHQKDQIIGPFTVKEIRTTRDLCAFALMLYFSIRTSRQEEKKD